MINPALFFDLDGTLADTLPDLHAAMNHVLIQHGYQAVHVDRVSHMIGGGARMNLQRGFDENKADISEADLDLAVDEFVNYYDANIDATTILFPHIWEILNAAQAANIKMAVITNKRESLAAKLLFRLNIHHYFELLIGGDTLAQRKPDALPITTAIEKLASSKDHAIMLGDSEADTASARAAGVKSICVSFGYRRVSLDQLEADAIIDSFSELPDAIEKLAPSRFPKLDWPSRTKL